MHRRHEYARDVQGLGRLRGMGRRSRRRGATSETGAPAHVRDRQARVRVSDEVWTDFQRSTAGRPIAVALGELVERRVDRYRARQVAQGTVDERELLKALGRARELHDELAAIVRRIEARMDVRTRPAE